MWERQRSAEDDLCEVALILSPSIAPAILFVSHAIRHALLEAMQNTFAYYPCSSLTYELHVHATRP